ncbi:RAB7A-interacting MON1-CCZ1 complex subunit 1-like [Oculina patagonica]
MAEKLAAWEERLEEVVDLAKTTIAVNIKELQEECIEIRKNTLDAGEHILLDKAEDKCKACIHLLEKGQNAASNKGMLYKILQQYSQALLDATYVVECRLVNEDFPRDRSEKEIKHLIERLDQPEEIVNEMFGSESKAGQVLGSEVMECLLWRRGALFYMYCHTLFNDPQRRQHNAVHLMQCAESGFKYLESMLCVRSPLVLDMQKNVEAKNADMVHLLREGVFSDTHLLALMYAGELCYWHWLIEKETGTDVCGRDANKSSAKNFNSVSNGKRFLQKFVDIVKESFKGKGWDCTRAEQILGEFEGS